MKLTTATVRTLAVPDGKSEMPDDGVMERCVDLRPYVLERHSETEDRREDQGSRECCVHGPSSKRRVGFVCPADPREN